MYLVSIQVILGCFSLNDTAARTDSYRYKGSYKIREIRTDMRIAQPMLAGFRSEVSPSDLEDLLLWFYFEKHGKKRVEKK